MTQELNPPESSDSPSLEGKRPSWTALPSGSTTSAAMNAVRATGDRNTVPVTVSESALLATRPREAAHADGQLPWLVWLLGAFAAVVAGYFALGKLESLQTKRAPSNGAPASAQAGPAATAPR